MHIDGGILYFFVALFVISSRFLKRLYHRFIVRRNTVRKRNVSLSMEQVVSHPEAIDAEQIEHLKYNDVQLPESVKQRASNDQKLPFTSALSVNDWLLLKRYNVKPIKLVMGVSHFQNGFSENFYFNFFYPSAECTSVENAIYNACELSLMRMQKEAALVGAHAVVGVTLKTRVPSLLSHHVECVFIGTAITLEGLEKPEQPILSTCTVPEFIKLVHGGSMPAGVALGAGVYLQQYQILAAGFGRNWRNFEIKPYTQSTYMARHIAMNNFKQDIQVQKGDGALCYQHHYFTRKIKNGNNDSNAAYVIHFIMFGTVVENTGTSVLPDFKLQVKL